MHRQKQLGGCWGGNGKGRLSVESFPFGDKDVPKFTVVTVAKQNILKCTEQYTLIV